jgi:hypothetical protein
MCFGKAIPLGERASRRRIFICCQGGKIFVEFVVRNMFGKPTEMQADRCNATKVVVQCVFALVVQSDLLFQGFLYFFETFDAANGFF